MYDDELVIGSKLFQGNIFSSSLLKSKKQFLICKVAIVDIESYQLS